MDFDQPPTEDSPDLTDLEIQEAKVTSSHQSLVALLKESLTGEGVPKYELRRRAPHLYLRVQRGSGIPLLAQVDWISDGK